MTKEFKFALAMTWMVIVLALGLAALLFQSMIIANIGLVALGLGGLSFVFIWLAGLWRKAHIAGRRARSF